MTPLRSFVIGTAGHIDHGKTALVRALTGVDTDRLPEEKRRGITIDLGFASMTTISPDGSSMRISFVDVPGHALFIRNMLAGTGCVRAVMLVIAANEGVMPQTREHLAICELLGIAEGFTVITKADLVSEIRLGKVREDVGRFLKGTFLESSALLAVSVREEQGLDQVREELATLAEQAHAAGVTQPIRLPIDRTFIMKGFGTIVTGTLLSGEIRVGETLQLEPLARSVRVRGVQTHGQAEDVATAGSRVAVNLSGVDANEIKRGQILVVPGELAATDVIDAEVTILDESHPLKHGSRIHFHSFTSEAMASAFLYSKGPVKPGQRALARLKLSSAIVLAPADRFVLRQSLPAGTIGGGRVLDAHPLLHGRRATTRSWLEALTHASPQQELLLRIRRRGVAGMRLHELVSDSCVVAEALRELLHPLLASGDLVRLSEDVFVAGEAVSHATELVLARLQSALSAGMKRSELQSQTGLPQELLHAAVERLSATGKVQQTGDVIAIAGAASVNEQRETAKLDAVSSAYRTAGLAPSSVREVSQQLGIAEAELRGLITLLLRQRSLVRMGSDDVFVHAEALGRLSNQLAGFRGKSLDVGTFKALTGLTRKHAIPLLEYLDRERITRKQGDQRIVL